MYGVGDARRTVAKPREGCVPARLVPCDQDDPGAHLCERYSGDLANSGRAACDDNCLPPHNALVCADCGDHPRGIADVKLQSSRKRGSPEWTRINAETAY